MLRGSVELDPGDLRTSAAVMLSAGVVLPLLPGHPGIECPLRRLTGIPCPLCGMTTSVEATLRGHFVGALAANPAGLPAVAAAIVLLLRRPRRIRIPAAAPFVVLPLLWLFELHRYAIL